MDYPFKARPKILCVDDEPGVLEALTRLFKPDFQVLTASEATSALAVIAEHPELAIILSDYRMPGKNGVELLRAARNFAPYAARAILSGQMDLHDVSEAINKAEIHRFLLKPWENDYLKLQVCEMLQMHANLIEKNELRTLAITDPITGLTNHRFFQESLKDEFEKAVQSGEALSIIMIDVDHFKAFNDRYGHPEGDRLLADISKVFAREIKSFGSVSRYGGEEFAAILPAIELSEAHDIADRIRRAVETAAFNGPLGYRAYVTISLGVASYPEQAQSANQLVQLADQALYQAKRQGRNQTVTAQLVVNE
jgi:diguanylate cyclase (GGDEF)-like protein